MFVVLLGEMTGFGAMGSIERDFFVASPLLPGYHSGYGKIGFDEDNPVVKATRDLLGPLVLSVGGPTAQSDEDWREKGTLSQLVSGCDFDNISSVRMLHTGVRLSSVTPLTVENKLKEAGFSTDKEPNNKAETYAARWSDDLSAILVSLTSWSNDIEEKVRKIENVVMSFSAEAKLQKIHRSTRHEDYEWCIPVKPARGLYKGDTKLSYKMHVAIVSPDVFNCLAYNTPDFVSETQRSKLQQDLDWALTMKQANVGPGLRLSPLSLFSKDHTLNTLSLDSYLCDPCLKEACFAAALVDVILGKLNRQWKPKDSGCHCIQKEQNKMLAVGYAAISQIISSKKKKK